MTKSGPRRAAGIEAVPAGRCPKCLSKRILGPRAIKDDGKIWCNCYNCGHEWLTNKDGNHHRKGCNSWNPKLAE